MTDDMTLSQNDNKNDMFTFEIKQIFYRIESFISAIRIILKLLRIVFLGATYML